SFVSASTAQGFCSNSGNTVTCNLDQLDVNGSWQVSITAAVDPGATGQLSNSASLAGTRPDTVNANNTATATNTVNHLPLAADDSYSTYFNTSLVVPAPGVLANDSDPDTDPLTAVLAQGPAHGSLVLNPDGSFTYSPAPGYSGPDSFTYTASDGTASSATATVQLTISAGGPPPTPHHFFGQVLFRDTPPGSSLQVAIPGAQTLNVALSPLQTPPSFGIDVPADLPGTPAKEGAAEGDRLTFSTGGMTLATALWHSGSNSRLDLHVLSLQPGWNLVSLALHPADTAVASVLSSLGDRFDLVYAWDGDWLRADIIPQTTDTLTALDEKQGFWVHITPGSPVILAASGAFPASTSHSLTNGWNLVGFPAAGPADLPAVFGSQPPNPLQVYAFHPEDISDPWKLYDSAAPGWVQDLHALAPGWGYWVRLNSPLPWTVNFQ
ncbi:MAG TPA: Ig-like domain-containing protein, partial [Anaerolineales bacterium]